MASLKIALSSSSTSQLEPQGGRGAGTVGEHSEWRNVSTSFGDQSQAKSRKWRLQRLISRLLPLLLLADQPAFQCFSVIIHNYSFKIAQPSAVIYNKIYILTSDSLFRGTLPNLSDFSALFALNCVWIASFADRTKIWSNSWIAWNCPIVE